MLPRFRATSFGIAQPTVETPYELEHIYKFIGNLTHVVEQHVRNDGGDDKRHEASCTIE